MSSKVPGSIPGHSTIFLCEYKMPNFDNYKGGNQCLPTLPNRLFLDQLKAEIRVLCSMALMAMLKFCQNLVDDEVI